MKNHNTSWETSAGWYDRLVGEKGHYYHEQIVLPGALRLLDLQPDDRLLDLACGQGVLSRHIPKKVDYVGVDISPALIRAAQSRSAAKFIVSDVTQPIKQLPSDFSHATFILALQNIENGAAAMQTAAHHLKKGGHLLLILNHPCFRIPRQSSWAIDETKKTQYRRVDRYLSPLNVPIQTHPGKPSETLVSFHVPLSTYAQWLQTSGFTIQTIEEWRSDKKSTGAMARMENRSREEFPLFLAVKAQKKVI